MASTSSATGEVASTSPTTTAVAEPVEIVPVAEPVEPSPPRWLSLSKPKQQKPTIMPPVLARTCSPCQRKGTMREMAPARCAPTVFSNET
ncbi:MAG: hypothetical protein LBI96_04785 [Odoribacteraceae bacterium]|nr:hypothetical protein [Odoribacteraceae bacterium]